MLFDTPKWASEILYEDREVICFVKPAGVLSQDTENEAGILQYVSDYTGGAVYPVHRLDRNTGGVMLAAKTDRAAAALSTVIAGGGIKKEYLAVAVGIPEKKYDTLEDELFFDRRKDKSFVVKKGSSRRGVKHASLEYNTLAEAPELRGRSASLLWIALHTGRTHQIRVQTANMGHPLFGDGKYGGGNSPYDCALWAFRLTLSPEALRGTPLRKSPLLRAVEDGISFTHIPEGGIWEHFPQLPGVIPPARSLQ